MEGTRFGFMCSAWHYASYPLLDSHTSLLQTVKTAFQNDSFLFSNLLDQAINHQYAWKNFFRDTFLYGHSLALPVAALIAFAYLFQLDYYPIIASGFLLSIGALYFLFRAMTYGQESKLKWLLLPVLAALIFSPSQISTYEFEISALADGLFFFGFTLGIWGLVRFPDKTSGVFLMVLGGVISTWSVGRGPLVWPSFLVGLLLLGFRKKTYFLVWIIGAALSSLPYFVYLIFRPISGHDQNFLHFIDIKLFITAIGYPLSQTFSPDVAYRRGWEGIALLFSVIGLFAFWLPRSFARMTAPAWILITFFILHDFQIGIFRDGIVPWYTRALMTFWLGLIGLAFPLWANKNLLKCRDRYKAIFFSNIIWCLTTFFSISYLYASSNWSILDKSFFTQYRSPVAISCILDHATAPPECEQRVFCWKLKRFEEFFVNISPLSRSNLSIFSGVQRRFLQGDVFLGKVRFSTASNTPAAFWSPDLSNSQLPFTDFHRLNLFLHSPNSADWNITLPNNIKSAELRFGTAISRSAPFDVVSDGVIFQISVKPEGGPEQILLSQFMGPTERSWKNFNLPLTQFSGKKIDIRFSTSGLGNTIHDWAMFRHPYIEISGKSGT